MKESKKRYRWFAVALAVLLVFDIFGNGSVTEASGLSRPKVTVKGRTKKTATLKMSSGSKVTCYHVYLKKGKKGKYSLTALVRGASSVKLKKLKATETYYVRVRSTRTVGLSIRKSKYSKVKKISPYVKKKKTEKEAAPTQTPDPTEAPPVNTETSQNSKEAATRKRKAGKKIFGC